MTALDALLLAMVLAVIAGVFSGCGTWARHVAVAFDAMCAVIAGGTSGLTISAWCELEYRTRRVAAWLRVALDKLEPDHCYKALVADTERARIVVQKGESYVR